ncbi:MAG: hypothetical protein WAK29_11130 [Terriglobales bacterium]
MNSAASWLSNFFPTWSRDGSYLYAEDYPDKTDDIVRIHIPDGKVERLFSLKAAWEV